MKSLPDITPYDKLCEIAEAKIAAETDPIKKAELQKELLTYKAKHTTKGTHKKVANFFGIKGIFWKAKSYILIAVTVLLLIVFYIMRRGAVVQ